MHAELASRLPGVSLPTVYATLELLDELGLVRRLATEGGVVVYDPRTHDHHHLVCRSCGRTVEITGSAVERWAHAVAEEHAFVDVTHTVELVGLCAACAAEAD